MPPIVLKDAEPTTFPSSIAPLRPEGAVIAKFGKCNMCSCPSYTTSSNDWQFCDCGHSRSAHQS